MKPEKTKAIMLMILCTVFISMGQYLLKLAGGNLAWTIQGTLLNWLFFAGLFSAAIGAVFMTLAFKYGELSALFPILALSFIWTIAIGVFLLGESVTTGTIVGIVFIIGGVIALGWGEEK